MARGADGDKYFSESADAEITRRLCETAPCTRRLDAVSDGTAVSRPLPAQCGQFLGRTFWRGRKLTLNLTKRRAHTPSIKPQYWTCLRSGRTPLVEMPIEVHIRRIEQHHPR